MSNILKEWRAASLALIMKMSCANLYANRTKNGGRILPDVKHECYGKLSVKSFLKEACYSINHVGISLQVNECPILAVLELHFMVKCSSNKSNLSVNRSSKCPFNMSHGTQKAIFLKMGGCSEVTESTVTCLLKMHCLTFSQYCTVAHK